MVAHMWPNGIPLQDVSFIDKEKRVTLAKHHFNYSILMKYKSEGDSIPHTATRDEGRELGYTDDADMVRGEPNTWLRNQERRVEVILRTRIAEKTNQTLKLIVT